MATIGGAPPIPGALSSGAVTLIIVTSVFTASAAVSCALRFLARRLTQSIEWDDWLSLGALVFAFGQLIVICLICTIGHAGYDTVGYNVSQLEIFLKLQFVQDLVYETSIALTKLSLLALYYRIFKVKSFKLIFRIFSAIVIAVWFSAWCRLVFAFNPIQAQWKFWLPHTNVNLHAVYLAGGIINTCLDFVILSLPQFYVWNLQLTLQRKLSLSLLFLIGLFTCVTSIVRIVYIQELDLENATFSLVRPGIWTVVESDLAIVCSCAPMFPGLLRYWYSNAAPSSMFKLSFRSSFSSWRRPVKTDESLRSDTSEWTERADRSMDVENQRHRSTPINVRTDIDVSHVEKTGSRGWVTDNHW